MIASNPEPLLKFVDKLTLLALLAGPAFAVAIQLWFEKRREARRAKTAVLDTLMAFRRRMQHSESVNALNRVQLVFKDAPDVLAKHRALIAHLNAERVLPEQEKPAAWDRREDLVIELVASMAKSLGYSFGHTELKGDSYLPQGWVNEETYQAEVRNAVMPILKGESPLLVRVEQE